MSALWLAAPVVYIKSKSQFFCFFVFFLINALTARSVWFLVDMNVSVPAALRGQMQLTAFSPQDSRVSKLEEK